MRYKFDLDKHDREKNNKIYTDFDINFELDESTGDIKEISDTESIKNSIWRIISLKKYDVPFSPHIESKLKELLFDIPAHTTQAATTTNLRWLIEELEPRVKVIDIDTSYDEEKQELTINVHYEIIRLNTQDVMTRTIQRER